MNPSPALISHDVRAALAEDIGSGDLTARLIPESRQATAQVISRENAILCGRPWFDGCFRLLDSGVRVRWLAQEGERIMPGQVVCRVSGPARILLTGERTAINFLQTLSGVATLTRQYVGAVAGTGVTLMDTRKTLPGLRGAEKYAVTVGGGKNQRMGLYDGVLIKENHIAAAGGIAAALDAARRYAGVAQVQIEVESLPQLRLALDAGATLVLLDNFTPEQLREAVALAGQQAILEASGGITLSCVRAIAETGVHRISVGSLTKHVRAVDFSMRHKDAP